MNKSKIIDAAVLVAYSAFLLTVVLHHEYWFDEAQAWVIARDNDLGGIVAMMKFEGHPPLWHFILKIFIALGCSNVALGLVSWGISTLAAAVVLFALPLKPYFKVALLLSSGMLYINSANSRVYCLINLLVLLIAWIYPHRKRLPVLFGISVALLANTHISMCGLVGIIGIFMLIDYFKDFKGNSTKQNVLNTLGLAIAGAGVVVLIIPLWNSFAANSVAVENEYTLRGVLSGFAAALNDNISCAVSDNLPSVLGGVISVAGQALFAASLVFLWTKRRAFVAEIVFAAVYFVINGAIWYTTPCRGAVFILAAAAIAVMFREEPSALNEPRGKDSEKFSALLAKSKEIAPIMCSCLLAMSIPSGAKYAADDLRGEFAPYKAAAEFIRENVPEDALLVSDTDDRVVLAAYLPEREIYALKYNRFYTYCSHEVYNAPLDKEKLKRLCNEHYEVYFIANATPERPEWERVYENSNCVPFVFSEDTVAIYKVTADDLFE